LRSRLGTKEALPDSPSISKGASLSDHPLLTLCKSAWIICSFGEGYLKCKLLSSQRAILTMCLLSENHQGYEQ
jgi:hypothetical protein